VVGERRDAAEGLLDDEARLAAALGEAGQELGAGEDHRRDDVRLVAHVEADRAHEERRAAADPQRARQEAVGE
jgi:hypothetical protein